MPIYEYECRKCKAHQEVMQKISDKPLTKCAKCGGQLEKQWSNTSFQFKGSGWYVTDYAGKKTEGPSASADESKQSADAGEKSDGKKTDSANEPAAKDAKESNANGKEKTAAKKTSNSKSSDTKSNATGGSSATGD